MPPKKRKAIGQVQPNAKRMKRLRRGESMAERERRLARQRERIRASRAAETLQQREARLQGMRERAKASRTVRQREARLQDKRERGRTSGAAAHFSFTLVGRHCGQHPGTTEGGNVEHVESAPADLPCDGRSGALLESELLLQNTRSPVMMSSSGESQVSSRSSQAEAPSQLSEEVKTETSGGGTSGSVGQASPGEQQNRAVQMKLTPQGCVKKEEMPELNICNSENDLNNVPDGSSIKEEKTEDLDYLYCEICKSYFFNKCEVHGPALLITGTTVPMGVDDKARQTLPPGLDIRKSGIPSAVLEMFNNGETVPVGSHFGPYRGELVDREEAMREHNGSRSGFCGGQSMCEYDVLCSLNHAFTI